MRIEVVEKKRRTKKVTALMTVCWYTGWEFLVYYIIKYTVMRLPREVEEPLRNDESARVEQIGGWQHRPHHHGSAPQNYLLQIVQFFKLLIIFRNRCHRYKLTFRLVIIIFFKTAKWCHTPSCSWKYVAHGKGEPRINKAPNRMKQTEPFPMKRKIVKLVLVSLVSFFCFFLF